jgi:LysR family transcriptional regulator, glycine cleavage system transcriptional activator
MSKPDASTPSQALPLNSIRVFVEAARQCSFSRAAVVLGMTQGGVSRHVATLEKYLGHALFGRVGTAVELTEVGRLYFDNVHEAMSSIELTTRQLTVGPAAQHRLVVRTSLPTLAMTVLIPALSQFAAESPVQVDVVTSLAPPGPADFYDVLITRDLHIDHAEQWVLADEQLVCVATPSVQAQFATLPMEQWPFVIAKSRPDTLALWAQQQGCNAPQVEASLEHYFLAIAAAQSGMGFLVVPHVLVAHLLEQKQLLSVALPNVRSPARYCAFLNPRAAQPEVARALCRWLKALFGRTAQVAAIER